MGSVKTDYGFSARLRSVYYVIYALLFVTSVCVVGFGYFARGIAGPVITERGKGLDYFLIVGHPVVVLALWATHWLMYNNWSAWRYYVHLGVCIPIAAYQGGYLIRAATMFIECLNYEQCMGQSPLGNPWLGAKKHDNFWLFHGGLVAVAFLCTVGMILFNFFLRNEIDLRLAIAMMSSGQDGTATGPSNFANYSLYGSATLGNELASSSSSDQSMFAPGALAAIISHMLGYDVAKRALIGDPLEVLHDEKGEHWWLRHGKGDESLYIKSENLERTRHHVLLANDMNLQIFRGPAPTGKATRASTQMTAAYSRVDASLVGARVADRGGRVLMASELTSDGVSLN